MMTMTVGYCQDVHSHVDDAVDFSNVLRNLKASRLGLECTAVRFCFINLRISTRSTKSGFSHLARTILTFDSPFGCTSRIDFTQSDFKPIRRVFGPHGLHGTRQPLRWLVMGKKGKMG